MSCSYPSSGDAQEVVEKLVAGDMTSRPGTAEECMSNRSSDKDDNNEDREGLGRRSGPRVAVSASPPANSTGLI